MTRTLIWNDLRRSRSGKNLIGSDSLPVRTGTVPVPTNQLGKISDQIYLSARKTRLFMFLLLLFLPAFFINLYFF